jgi:hypothetical protein
MSRIRRAILILLSAILLAGVGVILLSIRRWQDIAHLQSQFGRAWEISYNVNGSPRFLPKFVEKRAEDFFWKRYGSAAYPKNYPELLEDRFESLFVGRIKAIDIWYPETINNRLGSALKAFPALDSLSIEDGWERPVDEVEALAGTLADLELRRLALYGFQTLSTEAIQALARSDSLRELRISEARINQEAIATFTQWKTLEKLVLIECEYDGAALSRMEEARPTLLSRDGNVWGFCPVR